jgi:adenine deaminase
MNNNFTISGNIIDIENKKIYKGIITVKDGIISEIEQSDNAGDVFILPGFIDAHVHIESSLLIPSEFARLAVVHGTVATVSDPHEIGNVLGTKGVDFMIENGKTVPFGFYFGAPSCVPATKFETAGAEITSEEIESLLQRKEIKYLAEMMNWPGVIYDDQEVIRKIELAKKYKKPVDGHAPGLRGETVRKYINTGISTDHECFTSEEAEEKLSLGMKILIREGSAAKNFDELIDLLNNHEDEIMFCSDDKHPDNLLEGHINQLVKRALKKGIDLFKVLKAACVNPVKHYNMETGTLKTGDSADFIVADNLDELNVLKTFIRGKLVAEKGKSLIESKKVIPVNNFSTSYKTPEDFRIDSENRKVRVIQAIDGQLITRSLYSELPTADNLLRPDLNNDILKITVVNRYKDANPAVGFINGFGIKKGALASSVAHDSHNIVAVGTDDDSIARAVNEVIRNKGGLSAFTGRHLYSLPLSVAGLMSDEDGYTVAEKYIEIDKVSREMGSSLKSPFMTLSFMALLVIPSLKLSDLGLFDGDKFEFVSLTN